MPTKRTIQFYLNEEQWEALKGFCQEKESLGLCAKRLLLELIDQDKPNQPDSVVDQVRANSQRLTKLEERIDSIAQVLKDELSLRTALSVEPEELTIEPGSTPNIPPTLSYLYGIVGVENNKIISFWDGSKFKDKFHSFFLSSFNGFYRSLS